jgi:hypothetical protein
MTTQVSHPSAPISTSFVRAERYEQVICLRQRGPDTEMMMLFVQETGLRLPERLKRWAASSAFPTFFTMSRDAVANYPDDKK